MLLEVKKELTKSLRTACLFQLTGKPALTPVTHPAQRIVTTLPLAALCALAKQLTPGDEPKIFS